MHTLPRHQRFNGRHSETGAIHNYFACLGVKAPHTGQPYSEALLMGVSSGLLMGYFTFAYKGVDPHVALLTRNTFSPLDALLSRLGVVQHVRQTTDAGKALNYLLAALEDGSPALVWADLFSLPYNAAGLREDFWAMMPVLVLAHDGQQAWLADRSAVPLRVTAAELARARARVKKDRFRLLVLDPPDPARLPAAAEQGLRECARRYSESPVKSARDSFGLAAFQRWANALTGRDKTSWARVFPAGPALYAGLSSAFCRFELGTLNAERDRRLYADFLEEAALLCGRPALVETAGLFRASAGKWGRLSKALLPDSVQGFGETRKLIVKRNEAFFKRGAVSLAERQAINARLEAIRTGMEMDFPLSAAEAADLLDSVRRAVLAAGDAERVASESLQAALAGQARRRRAAA